MLPVGFPELGPGLAGLGGGPDVAMFERGLVRLRGGLAVRFGRGLVGRGLVGRGPAVGARRNDCPSGHEGGREQEQRSRTANSAYRTDHPPTSQ
jgi:hypothetical protein